MTAPDRQALMAAREALEPFAKWKGHSGLPADWPTTATGLTLGDFRRARSVVTLIDAALAEAAPAGTGAQVGELIERARKLGKPIYSSDPDSQILTPRSLLNALATAIETLTRKCSEWEKHATGIRGETVALLKTIDDLRQERNGFDERLTDLHRTLELSNGKWLAAESTNAELRSLLGRLRYSRPVGTKDPIWDEVTAASKGAAQLEARPTTASGEWKPTHQHYKGGYYRVMARGRIEADLSPVVIYDNEAGETWVRPVDDFDQRDPFVRFAALALPRSPASPEPEKGEARVTLRVTVEIIPFGVEANKRVLDVMNISNITARSHSYENQYGEIADYIVRGHRRREGYWELIRKILNHDPPTPDSTNG